MTIVFHRNTDPHCGAVGPIAYKDKKAWSVNVYPTASGPDRYKVMDWRFELDYTMHNCTECQRLVKGAKEES